MFVNPLLSAQPLVEELLGRYRIIYDSTHIWPDGKGGYEYTRTFMSEVILAEKGRSVLSHTATPVLHEGDEIDLEAYTVLPSGEIYPVDDSDIITRYLSGDTWRIFVNFRRAEPGASLHVEWTLTSQKANIAGRRYFGRTVPVESAIIVLTAPETWVLKFAFSPDILIHEDRRIEPTRDGLSKVRYRWTASDLDGLSQEEYSPPFERIIPALYFSLYLDRGWSGADAHRVNWALISQLYNRELESFLKSKSSLDPLIDSLILFDLDQRESAVWLFDWVRDNFRSLYSDITLSRDLDKALERGRGSQAEGAALYYALISKLGIPCGIYLAATRDAGEPLTDLPALFWFDRLLVACFVDGDTAWADPFYPVSELGILPFEDQGIRTLRLDRFDNRLGYTPDIDFRANGKAIHLKLHIDSLGALHGEATEIYSGAMIPEISSYLISLDEGQRMIPWERRLAMSFPGVQLKKFMVMPPDSAGMEYRVGYSFSTAPIIRPFARRAYIPMDLLGRWEDLPNLPEKDRKFPIVLRRPRFEFERITLTVSPPFEVEYIPKNYSLNTHIGEIYSVARRGENSVTITRGFGLKRSTLPVSAYKSLRKFLVAARTEADKQIILRRTE